jgi:hypothetical protein
MNQHPPGQGAD